MPLLKRREVILRPCRADKFRFIVQDAEQEGAKTLTSDTRHAAFRGESTGLGSGESPEAFFALLDDFRVQIYTPIPAHSCENTL